MLKIKSVIEARGWTAIRLTAALEQVGNTVHPITVQNWIDGKFAPNLENARAIAAALGCTVDDLFE